MYRVPAWIALSGAAIGAAGYLWLMAGDPGEDANFAAGMVMFGGGALLVVGVIESLKVWLGRMWRGRR